MNRRTFVSAAIGALANPTDRAVAQAYIWTQEMKRRNLTLEQGLSDIFASTKRAGFNQIELMQDFFAPALRDKTLAELRRNAMTAPIVYFGGTLHDNVQAEATCRRALELAGAVRGAGTIALNHNPDPKLPRAPKAEWELNTQCEWLDHIGRELAKKGLAFYVHHHDPEMADEAEEWRFILSETDPAVVSLCIDTHWAFRGGQDPLSLLKEAGSRTASLHLRNSVNKVWSEDFSDGDIDYRPIAAWLRSQSFNPWLVVELATEPGTPSTRSLEENLKRSRRHLNQLFGV